MTLPNISVATGPQSQYMRQKIGPTLFDASANPPTEIRQIVYKYLYDDCTLSPQDQALIRDEEKHEIELTSTNYAYVKCWLAKKSSIASIHALKSASSEFAADLASYEALKSSAACLNITIAIIWIEDLGQLLTELGLEAKKNITSLKFSWDTYTRDGTTNACTHSCNRWHGDEGMAGVFRLLADCPNLKKVRIGVDAFKLAHSSGDGVDLTSLESYRALQDLRLGPDATVDLEYCQSSTHSGNWTPPIGFLEDLKDRMLQPRETEQEVLGRFGNLALNDVVEEKGNKKVLNNKGAKDNKSNASAKKG